MRGGGHTGICRFTYGYSPDALDCRAKRDADAHLPWWRKLWREFTGHYCCDRCGELPCDIHDKRMEDMP